MTHQLVNVREAVVNTITIPPIIKPQLIKHQAISHREAPKFKILADVATDKEFLPSATMLKSNVTGSLSKRQELKLELEQQLRDKLREELELTDPSCQIWECRMLALDRRILVMLSTFQVMLMFIVCKLHLAKVSKANFRLANEEVQLDFQI